MARLKDIHDKNTTIIDFVYICIQYVNNIQKHTAMAQKKGQTGNPNGRPKGTPNKVTSDMKEKVRLFIESNFNQIQKDFAQLEPRERVTLYERMLKYIIPQKVENELIESEPEPKIIINLPGMKSFFNEIQSNNCNEYAKPLELTELNN